MATQVAKRPAGAPARPKKKSYIMDIAVDYANVSVGDMTCRIGCKADKAQCNTDAAEDAFASTRIKGRIVLGGEGDAPGQQRFVEDSSVIEASFDSKSWSSSGKKITFGLTMNLKELGDDRLLALCKFAKRKGRLQIESVDEIEASGDEDASAQQEAEDEE